MDYRTQAGDTMFGIAEKFHLSLATLKEANPQIVNPSLIFPNEIIHVPTPGAANPRPRTVPARIVTYLVQPGDTMSGIAVSHGIGLSALEAANPQVTNPHVIVPGQVLNIPGGNGHHAHLPSPTHVSSDGAISIDEVSYVLYSGGGEVDSWTSDACQILSVPARHWITGYRVLCSRESSGRANAINNSDGNAWGPIQDDGFPLHCSRGVAQCIPDTFASNHAAETSTSIYDPVANIAASMHYVMQRYGVFSDASNLAAQVQQADPNRSPAGY